MSKSRNPSIDVYRAVLMFGIVLLHIVSAVCYWDRYSHFARGLLFCVDGFVFITGYYGISFSFRKLVMLYAVALWSIFLVIFLGTMIYSGDLTDIKSHVFAFLRIFNALWFLHAYAVLMCFSNIVNFIMETAKFEDLKKILMPILFAIFVWGLGENMKWIHWITPKTPGLTAASGFTLMGIYIVARLYKMYEARFDAVDIKWYFASLPILFFICSFGMGWLGPYNSPFAVATALVTFHLFKRLRIPPLVARIALFMAPSVFAIYILHANFIVNRVLLRSVDLMSSKGTPHFVSCIMCACCCFLLCLIVDLPRRVVSSYIRMKKKGC